MNNRAIEFLALKLAESEANRAIIQAQLEQSEYQIKELEKQLQEAQNGNGEHTTEQQDKPNNNKPNQRLS